MAKQAVITDVSTGYQSNTTLNNNFEALNDAFVNTLSRDGSTPNNMEADLDMDSNDILNVSTLGVENIVLDGTPITPTPGVDVSFEDRDELVSVVSAGATWELGTVVSDSSLMYVAVPVATTTIPDLPGLEPISRVFVGHWGVEGTDIGTGTYMATPTVDESSLIQTAMNWCLSNGKNLFGDLRRSYGVSSQIVWGANGTVVPKGMATLTNFQYTWIGAADTAATKTADDADDWLFTNEAALVVGGAAGSTPGKYLVSVKGLRGDGQRIKNVVQFRQMFSATCTYFAERGLDYEVRIGEENDDALNTTNCDYQGFSRHYAFQERSDGSFGADDGTGWYGLTGRTSVGHLIESSDVQIFSTGNTGLHSLLLRESFNVEMSTCKWWNGPGPGNPAGFVTAIITKSAGNYALRGGQVQDGAIRIFSPNGIIDSVRFLQYTFSPVQLVTDTADSTWEQFKIVNCIADFSATNIALDTIGSGSWKFFEGTFFGNSNFQGAPLTIQDRQWNIGDVRDPFHTRGELQFALQTLGWEPPTGRTFQIGELTFAGEAGATSITDMPGVVAVAPVYPEHYAFNTTPGTTDMGFAILDALSNHDEVFLSDTSYATSVEIKWNNKSLRGKHNHHSKIVGLSGSLPVGTPIVTPGRSATFTDVWVEYDSLTGSEAQDERVGICLGGDGSGTFVLQRAGKIDNIVVNNCGTAIGDMGRGVFSATIGAIEVKSHSYAGIDVRGENRTGNTWGSIYINGQDSYVATYGANIAGQLSGGVFDQLNVEHNTYSGSAFRAKGCHGLNVTSLHIEGVDTDASGKSYIEVDESIVQIGTLSVLNTRMSFDDTRVVELKEADYGDVATYSGKSSKSGLVVGTYHVKGLAAPNTTLFPGYPSGRRGLENILGFEHFYRSNSYTDNDMVLSVDQYTWAAYNARSASIPFYEFADTRYSNSNGNIRIERFGPRGTKNKSGENFVRNAAFDDWVNTSVSGVTASTETAEHWFVAAVTGSIAASQQVEDFGKTNQYFIRVDTTGTAGDFQRLYHDVPYYYSLLDKELTLSFDMKSSASGRVLEQITASLFTDGGGTS